jgi:hypothetical protein
VSQDTSNINPAEFGRFLKERYGEFTPAVVVVNMHRHLTQELLNSGQISDPGAETMLRCHFAVLQILMQALGKNAADIPKLLKMADEANNAATAANAVFDMGKRIEVEESAILAPPRDV